MVYSFYWNNLDWISPLRSNLYLKQTCKQYRNDKPLLCCCVSTAISKDSDDSQHALLSKDSSSSRQDLPKAPIMEKFRKLSEGKGRVTRPRQDTGAPVTTSKETERDGTEGGRTEGGRTEGGRTEGGRTEGGAESNGLPPEQTEDTEDDDDGEREDDEDSSEGRWRQGAHIRF